MNLNVEDRITLDKFQPRWYQEEIFYAVEKKGYRKVLAILPRRAGKDITGWNLAIRTCLEKTRLVFYCLPTYSQARKCIFDAITIDGLKFLDYIPKRLIKSINISEMKITFINDSILQVQGADSFDTSLVGTNPYAVFLSEYALMSQEVYSYIRPILAANGGYCVILSCVSPETLVLTEYGLRRIKDLSDSRQEYTDYNKPIFGLGGFHNAEQYYYGGKQNTLKITLESGYQLECTPIHPIWNGKEWIKSQDLKLGDLIPIQYGQDVWGQGLDLSQFHKDISIDNDFFYLLGLIHADGNYDKNKVCVTKKKDPEIIEFLQQRGFRTRADGIHHEFNSRPLCRLLEFLEFKHGARNKTFPNRLLSCNKNQLRAFLQGVFDGDGCSASGKNKRGYVKLTSTCHEFIKDLQIVLLNFGIVSSLRSEFKEPTKLVKVSSTIYNLEITGYFAHIFYRDIGFRLARKQANWENVPANLADESGNVYPVDVEKLEGYSLPKWRVTNPERMTRRLIAALHKETPNPYLQQLLAEKFFYSPIKSIEESENEVFDFVIPETNSFFSNGLISHNTPRGKNHLWHLWKVAQELDDWHIIRRPTSEIQHIPEDVLERERAQMDPGMYDQEYEVSFERGISGAFYGKHLDQLRDKGQITHVPWEPGLLVYVAIDIGVNDATSMVFWQTVGDGTILRIIDYYSNNNLGLDHYAKILQDKPYKYGKIFCPADIKVREWGGGAITRYEKARQLGLNLTVLEQIPVIDGIENVWTHFPKFWIDQEKCRSLIDALENYRKEWSEPQGRYLDKPVKSWANHGADALRYMCQSLHKTKKGMSPEEFERAKAEALYGGNGLRSHLPPMFR